jgi:hypothetical protein
MSMAGVVLPAGGGSMHVRVGIVVSVGLGAVLLSGPGVRLEAQSPAAGAAAPAPVARTLTLEQQEAFLKKANIVRTRGAGKGVTGTLRATLSDGSFTHDASIQTIDERLREFRTKQGVELNFRDSWQYNVAAYRLDQLLGLDMTPPSVERNYNGKPGAFTWWVDDVLMDEHERYKTDAQAPDVGAWNAQMWHVRMFDQLIHNIDRNLGNLLIDQKWKVWMIDHSRSFRLARDLRSPETLTKVDRQVFERLKALDEAGLRKAISRYVTGAEIRALLARRDAIVALIDQKGDGGLFDWVRP